MIPCRLYYFMENQIPFSRVIRQFEERFGCFITFHDFSGEISAVFAPEAPPLHHANLRCEAVRTASAASYRRCLECDVEKIQKRIFESKMFWKDCHAGFRELVFPIFSYSAAAGVMFIGVFGKKGLPEAPADLPTFGALLADALRRRLERLPETGCSSVRNRIQLWFIQHFRNPETGREDLARAMRLSESRISQLLRSEFDNTFPELLNSYRVECAKQILENSDLGLEEVARLAGFRSANYLHRCFKRQTGTTPANYRSGAGQR